MAKPSKTGNEQEGEISVSMVKFTMKGSDASLQKGLDTIKAALAQAGFAPEPRFISRLSSPRQPQEHYDDVAPSDIHEPIEIVTSEDIIEHGADPAAPTRVRKAAQPRKVTNYKILAELRFDDVSPSLEEFVSDKGAKTNLDRYLCVAYWFKHYKNLEDLSVEHFFTATRVLKWQPQPKDPAQPVGDLRKPNKQYLTQGTSQGTSTITNAGERHVLSMGRTPTQ